MSPEAGACHSRAQQPPGQRIMGAAEPGAAMYGIFRPQLAVGALLGTRWGKTPRVVERPPMRTPTPHKPCAPAGAKRLAAPLGASVGL